MHLLRSLFLLFLPVFAALTPAPSIAHPIDANRAPIAPFVFKDGDGVAHALADYRGRFVLLVIWATWCPPCVKEMPVLNQLQKRMDPQQFIVLPISEDGQHGAVPAFYRRQNIDTLPVALDSAQRAEEVLGLERIPTTILIDPNGYEVTRFEGSIDWLEPINFNYLKKTTQNFQKN